MDVKSLLSLRSDLVEFITSRYKPAQASLKSFELFTGLFYELACIVLTLIGLKIRRSYWKLD